MKYFAVIENESVVGVLVSEETPEDERTLIELDGNISPKPFPNAKLKLDGNKVVWDLADKANAMREKRNQLLCDSDWSAIRSIETGSISKPWQEYRQALRDLTKQKDFPNVDFPVPPAV